MKVRLFTVLFLSLFLVSSCVSKKREIIVTKRFVLAAVNGDYLFEDSSDEEKPFIEFDQKGFFFGKACNEFVATYEVYENRLFAQILMTKMLCTDETLNILDQTIGDVFTKGAQVTVKEGLMTIHSSPHTLLFTQYAN